MCKTFNFRISTNLVFGENAALQLGEILRSFGYQKTGIIVDRAIFQHPHVLKAIESARAAVNDAAILKNESVEPTYDDLEAFRKKIEGKEYDCLVGIGGGSTLDLAKGTAVLLTNHGSALSYKGFPKLERNPLPVIALPTTAGTGSEATYNAVFTDSALKKKLGINTVLNFPVKAIVDPVFALSCPKGVTISSGCDALVHTLESYVHKNHTQISRIYSQEAFRLLFNGLSNVLDKPKDLNIRADLALGAYLAGVALINAGSGPSGAFSYPLGAAYKVPHGYAGAIFIASITKINMAKGYKDYGALYDLIEGADTSLSCGAKQKAFSEKIQELMNKLDVPRSLSEYGLIDTDIQFLIDQYDVLRAAIDQNPIEITKDDVRQMMRALA